MTISVAIIRRQDILRVWSEPGYTSTVLKVFVQVTKLLQVSQPHSPDTAGIEMWSQELHSRAYRLACLTVGPDRRPAWLVRLCCWAGW